MRRERVELTKVEAELIELLVLEEVISESAPRFDRRSLLPRHSPPSIRLPADDDGGGGCWCA